MPSTSLLTEPRAPKHRRFRILRALGTGGRGTVFEAIDRLDGSRVALKTLNDDRASTARELKADFRRLADVHHPNLVDYYELHTDGRTLFFSMSLIEGTDIVDALRTDLAIGQPLPENRYPAFERAALQLAAAVQALHDRDLLHRDIKPSNVMVERQGRLVLLDFGLAIPWPSDATVRGLVGTPTYMSPERLESGTSLPESDWYSVGAVLGEILTGWKPGPLENGGDRFPLPDNRIGHLVRRLTARAPEDRGGIREIELALGCRPSSGLGSPVGSFVGRDQELERLRRAWFQVRSTGRAVGLRVRGPSGMGKSALIERFASELEDKEAPVDVLRGRCHPRETLPFGALDAWLDHLAADPAGLARSLAELDADVDLATLGVVFPALSGPLAGLAPRTSVDRHRVEAARVLGRLLAVRASTKTMVLICDDAQWVDADSGRVLEAMQQELVAQPILLLWVERTGLPDTPIFDPERELDAIPLETLDLGPLERSDSLSLLARSAPAFRTYHDRWVDASEGSPLLLTLLGELEVDPGADDPWWRAIDERLQQISVEGRRLLEWVCVHGGPLDVRLISEGRREERAEVVATLEKARWIRFDDRGESPRIAPHHDRVREAVLTHMDETRLRAVHGMIADALVDTHGGVGEIAGHLVAADRVGAGVWAARAGLEAAAQHAYARARRWLEVALGYESGVDRRMVLAALGEVLRHLGEAEPAARAFLAAAGLGDEPCSLESVRMRCRAGELLLASGHLEDGRNVLEQLLDEVGLSLPRGGPLGMLRAALERARVRRLPIPEPRATPLTGLEHNRLEVAYTAVTALGLTDSVAAGVLQAEHLRLAAAGGDLELMSRALGADLVYRAASGYENDDLERVRDALERMALTVDNPEARAFARASIGYSHFLRGDFVRARTELETGADAYARLETASWTSRFVEIHLAINDVFLGALEQAFSREARVRPTYAATRDYVALAYIALGVGYVRALAEGRPDEVEREVEVALGPWPTTPPVLAYLARCARIHACLYRADYRGAQALLRSRRFDPVTRAAFQHMRVIEAWFEGVVALSRGRTRKAIRAANAIRREGVGWGVGLYWMLLAGAQAQEGNPVDANELARRAEEAFQERGMRLYARAAAAWRAHLPMSGLEIRRALKRFAKHGVADPAAMLRAFAPPLPKRAADEESSRP